jgi:hypothetical protein
MAIAGDGNAGGPREASQAPRRDGCAGTFQLRFGRLYFNGEGVAKDVREACRWYAVSAGRFDAAGKQNDAFCKAKGWAPPANLEAR